MTVNPLAVGLAESVSCYLNDVELEEERGEHLVMSCYQLRWTVTCLLQKSSHLTELRREISGLSQLASDFYAASQQSEADRVSLDRSGLIKG